MHASKQVRLATVLLGLVSACAVADDGSNTVSVARRASALHDAERWQAPASVHAKAPGRAKPAAAYEWIAPRYRAFASAFDAEREQLGLPGAAVALLENGRLAFAHGSGVKDPNTREPVDADTLFRIGSMTKALTATALLAAADEHGLRLDDPVQKLLPDVPLDPAQYAALTFEQLLSHQSGLVDYLEVDGPREDSGLADFLTSADFAKDFYFMVPPGTFYDYANVNYALAGLALERLDGRYYRHALARRVLRPLGMRRTLFLPDEVLADGDYSAGTTTNASGAIKAIEPDAYDNAWARPAGYAYSSVSDYARFMEFLLRDRPWVLWPRSWKAQQTAHVLTHEGSATAGYGYGLAIQSGIQLSATEYYEMPVVLHDGRINGYQSVFVLLPSAGFGAVIFGNSDSVPLPRKSLVQAIKQFVTLPEPKPIPAADRVDPGLYPEFAGTYVDTHQGMKIEVTATTDALHISVPDLDAQGVQYDKTLQPLAANMFRATIASEQAPLSFVQDDTGQYVWLRSRSVVAKRVPSP